MSGNRGEQAPGASGQADARRPAVRLGSWELTDAEGGGSVAVDARLLAVASQAHLAVWAGGQRLAAADAPWPAPGKPRFARDRVFWGPGVLDLRSGRYSVLAPGPASWPGGAERPQVHAWSATGERLLVSYATGDPARPTRVDLLAGADGATIAARWSASALAPEAAWVGQDVAVAGFADLEVIDAASGAVRGQVGLGAGSVISLDADAAERRLVAVDLNRAVFLIDLYELRIVDRWAGRWLDAALTPDGQLAVALDLAGRLHFADIASHRFRPLGEADNVVAPGAVTLGPGVLAVAGGGVAARAGLAIER
jgi:hypothetical protein